MNRGGTSGLLIPLFAAMALFYPVANRKSPSPSTQTLTSTESARRSEPGKKQPEEWARGRRAVQSFFGPRNANQKYVWPGQGLTDPRKTATLKFLIVTVPDPIDSGLPHVFDRYLASIQSAVQTQPYFLSKFDLPWQDCLLLQKEKDGKDADKDRESKDEPEQPMACTERRFAKEPGFLLLSNPTSTQKSKVDLLLIYVIGETPTAGIHKRALLIALNEISRYCGWRKEGTDPVPATAWPESPDCKEKNLRILAPYFSGSAQSLDLALSYWLDSIHPAKPGLRLISGSATAIAIPDENATADPNVGKKDEHDNFYYTRSRLGSNFYFRSMERPDKLVLPKLWDYLAAAQPCGTHLKIAMLVEGGTAYGHASTLQGDGAKDGCIVSIERTSIPYPLHISQLRAASEKLRQLQEDATPQPQISNKALPLAESLEDAGLRREMRALSPADAVTAEQVMSNLLSTISHEGYEYVGITATDIRDVMFLAQEVREHAPATVLFTFSADLLFLHPEINETLRGMLVVTSYPLINSNQLWSLPAQPGGRFQFPDDGAEGVYDATLALLGDDERMMEYSAPFTDMHHVSGPVSPPIWITVVGRDRLWPAKVYDLNPNDPEVKSYSYPLYCERAGSTDPSLWWRGLYPDATLIFSAAFAALCIIFCLPLLSRFAGTAGKSQLSTITGPRGSLETGHRWRWKWFDRTFGEAVSEQHRRTGELYLLAAAATLLAFLIVLSAVLATPAGAMFSLNAMAWNWRRAPLWVGIGLGLACFAALILLITGSAAVFRAMVTKRPENRRLSHESMEFTRTAWLPIAGASLVAIVLASVLSWTWISELWSSKGDFRSALFASLRSLDLWSGVSPLLPLFLISSAGFLWALGSFLRVRELDACESKSGPVIFGRLEIREIDSLQQQLSTYLTCPSLKLPGAIPILLFALTAGTYLWHNLVPSLEYSVFYRLLAVSFFSVNLALWYGVLRFCRAWRQTHHLLNHIALLPLRAACKRFRGCFPALPKIGLASSGAALAHLECSVRQAQTLQLQAESAGEVRLKVVGGPVVIMAKSSDSATLRHLGSAEIAHLVHDADEQLMLARRADADGRWREVITCEWESREALSRVAAEVKNILENSSWGETHKLSKETSESANPPAPEVIRFCEDFLVGRIAHFLSCVFSQMQNLIFTSVAGLLLLLFAVSSYPFQPHNLLLLSSWMVILSVVGIALWVFVQMSRDPVLSYLNGTRAGKISWDGEFIFRVFIYGIVPILALLGAQFPQSFGQILSHLIPSEGMHP